MHCSTKKNPKIVKEFDLESKQLFHEFKRIKMKEQQKETD